MKNPNNDASNKRVRKMPVSSVYPLYITKAERKGRTKEEVDTIIYWLTGHDDKSFKTVLDNETNFEEFFTHAPQMNDNRKLITGTICGINIAEITDPIMLEVRYLDKLIDELANGKAMEKILRKLA